MTTRAYGLLTVAIVLFIAYACTAHAQVPTTVVLQNACPGYQITRDKGALRVMCGAVEQARVPFDCKDADPPHVMTRGKDVWVVCSFDPNPYRYPPLHAHRWDLFVLPDPAKP